MGVLVVNAGSSSIKIAVFVPSSVALKAGKVTSGRTTWSPSEADLAGLALAPDLLEEDPLVRRVLVDVHRREARRAVVGDQVGVQHVTPFNRHDRR